MVLSLPTSGVRRSVGAHNSSLDVAVDWLELCVLLSDDEWFPADVVDALHEGEIYDDQEFSAEFVESMYAELRRRRHCLGGGYPLSLEPSGRLTTLGLESSAFGFCLLLSLGPHYSGWSGLFGGDYREQGLLFERVSVEALQYWFPRWEVRHTGWADGAAMAAAELVGLVAEETRENSADDYEQWISPNANDVGLDIAVVRPFEDDRGGVPVLMWQCASGQDWWTKLHTPDTAMWLRVLTLTHEPTRGFSAPIAIPAEEFDRRRNQAHGVLLDRCRLLPPIPEAGWLSPELADRLRSWNEVLASWLLERYPSTQS